eukprot:4045241-Pyramimonas_sp.AAC.1
MPPRRPKMHSRRPEMALRWFKTTEEAPSRPPRQPQRPPRGPQEGAKEAKLIDLFSLSHSGGCVSSLTGSVYAQPLPVVP